MSVPLFDPSFPVIEKEPSVSKIVSSFRREDWLKIAGVTAFGAPLGYWIGYKANVTRASMYMTMFLLGGTMFTKTIQTSTARLMGYAPNYVEQEAAWGKKGL